MKKQLLLLGFVCALTLQIQANTEPIVWLGQNNVSVAADGSITSTTNNVDGSTAYSQQTISTGDGTFSFTANNAIGYIGVTPDPSQGISVGQYLSFEDNGILKFFNNGIARFFNDGTNNEEYTDSWVSGDQFSLWIGSELDSIYMTKNGSPLFSFPSLQSDYHLKVIFSGTGTGFDEPVISKPLGQKVAWKTLNNAELTPEGNIIATTDASFGASGKSEQKISGEAGGFFEFTTNNMTGFIGLSDDPDNDTQGNIDYAIQPWSQGRIYIKESGSDLGVKSSWTKGDVFRIEIIGEQEKVQYLKNGEVFYESLNKPDPTKEYQSDFSFGGANRGFDQPEIFAKLKSCAYPTEGLIAEILLNGDATDATGNGNDGIASSGVTYTEDRFGMAGQAMLIDSKSDLVSFDGFSGNTMSFALWHQFDRASGWNTLLQSASSRHPLIIGNTGSSFVGNIGLYNSGFVDGGINLEQDKWYQFVVIMDGTNYKLYVNGVLALNTTTTFSLDAFPLKTLGNEVGGTQGALGVIDDFLVYDRALTEEEISAMFCDPNDLVTTLSSYKNESLELYPNPAQNELYLSSSLEGVKVYNVLGEPMNLQVQDSKVDLSELKSGVYILTGTKQGNAITHRFVKQ